MLLSPMIFLIVALKVHRWITQRFPESDRDRSQHLRILILTVLVSVEASLLSQWYPRIVSLTVIGWMTSPMFASIRSWLAENKKWSSESTSFYDHALLEIRSGKGVREIFAAATEDPCWSLKHRQILSRALQSAPNETQIGSAERRRDREVRSVLEGGARCGDRLQTFREQARIDERLQRLKVRALRLARAQSLIVVLLFLGLSALQGMNDGNFFFSIWFKSGVLLLALGLAALLSLGRGFRWRT